MKYSYSCSAVREADCRTIESGVPASELMERAGQALADRVSSVMHEQKIDDALFVCGGGNNGGDGFVAARILADAGKEVSVLCVAEKFSEDCERAKAKYRGEILGKLPRRRYALIVDCLFGTGLTREVVGTEAALIDMINGSGAYVISCDLPSGLGESGIAYSHCVHANETLTIGYLKNALLLADGADHAGKISVADIGILPPARGAEIWEKEDVKRYFPPRASHTHKGSFGNAAIFAGSKYTGAAFLAAGACLKSGAGYTRLIVPKEIYSFAIGKLPACVLKAYEGIGDLLSSNAVALGMGAEPSEHFYEFLKNLISHYTGTLVLDADALNTLSLFGVDVLKKKQCNVIITPHIGEFSRLTKKSVQEILREPVELATEFAKAYGVVVVLKNNRSVIADGERVAINTTGSPALAKGGSGDVLSGLLAGTVSRGVPGFEAACVASFVLGKAGEYAAREMGEYAPDATDVIAYLPKVMRDIAL